MTEKQIAMINELDANIRTNAGDTAADAIMQGASDLNMETSSIEIAEWVKHAIERLDAVVSENMSAVILTACGQNCTRVNHEVIEKFQERRAKFPSLDTFLEAEEQDPMEGTKLWREEDAVVYAFCPRELSQPMRCLCELVKDLPADDLIYPSYCQCSRAFVGQMWEETLGQPVAVDLLESIWSGATECRFRISF